ncbi:outer membrane protein [Sphingomonas glaciei]|uniref:Outer membrane beta-barrel protein n=1 Tax=Sphingomonas glaciei TaxID=2938948 RepID=A0ABY5MTX4_9SPHN|nr:outer membrane beta-barrel protein [Sphingomonas glaciei]UUR07643.1 outer membrane beta-barrel protein [Sphingomonas glaciei]
MSVRPLAASLLAATLAATALSPASAQSNAARWSGPYVGGQAGIGNIDNDRPQVLFDTNRDGTFTDTVRTSGGANAFSPGFCDGRAQGVTPNGGCDNGDQAVEYGAHVGYDMALGNLVVGVVGEYDRSNLKDSVSAFSTTPANYVLTRELRDSFGLRARAGVALDDTLLYATAGAIHGRFRNSFASSNTANAFAVTDARTSGWGYRAGGGVEQRLGGNLSIGLLYLYSSIKDDGDNRIDVTRGTAPATTNPFVLVNAAGTQFQRTDDRFRSHSAKVTASLRF